MAVTSTEPAPYAPPSAVMAVVERYRSKGMPSPITAEVLGRAGISDSLIPRTLQALEALDLIDEKGVPSQILEGLRRAPEGEYKSRLVEWLNGAYADVLNFVDPAVADETAVRDAFRNYVPIGQQSRMVTLFMGLYGATGMRSDKEKISAPRAARPRPLPIKSLAALRAKAAATKNGGAHPVGSNLTPEIPPALSGLLASLPSRGWTPAKRNQFVTMFSAALDYCIPIVEEVSDNTSDETDTDE